MYAASSSSSKRDLALSLGACEYIDSSKTDIAEYMQSLGGANLIVCTAPYSHSINAIIPAVAKNGRSCTSIIIGVVASPTDLLYRDDHFGLCCYGWSNSSPESTL